MAFSLNCQTKSLMCPTLKTSSGIITISAVKGLWQCNVLILWQSVEAYPPLTNLLQFRYLDIVEQVFHLTFWRDVLRFWRRPKMENQLSALAVNVQLQWTRFTRSYCYSVILFLHTVQGLKTSPRISFIYSNIPNSSLMNWKFPF